MPRSSRALQPSSRRRAPQQEPRHRPFSPRPKQLSRPQLDLVGNSQSGPGGVNSSEVLSEEANGTFLIMTRHSLQVQDDERDEDEEWEEGA